MILKSLVSLKNNIYKNQEKVTFEELVKKILI